jgi:hypothetical protein
MGSHHQLSRPGSMTTTDNYQTMQIYTIDFLMNGKEVNHTYLTECSNQEVHLTSGGQSKNRQVENSKEKDSLSKEEKRKQENLRKVNYNCGLRKLMKGHENL